MSIISAIWKLKKVVTINPTNYDELKKVTDLVDSFIKNKQAVLSKKQNKIFNQQKNEIKRFEDSLEAVPVEGTSDVLPFRYKKTFKQEIDEMSKPAPTVIEECAAFPYGDHDDLVDSTTQAVMRFRQGGLIPHPEDYKIEKIIKTKREYY